MTKQIYRITQIDGANYEELHIIGPVSLIKELSDKNISIVIGKNKLFMKGSDNEQNKKETAGADS